MKVCITQDQNEARYRKRLCILIWEKRVYMVHNKSKYDSGSFLNEIAWMLSNDA